jgi:hypothetical protein
MTQINNTTAVGTPPEPNFGQHCWIQNYNDVLGSCVLPSHLEAVGNEAVFAVLVLGTVGVGLAAAADGDTTPPVTVLLLVGGILISALGAGFAQAANSLVVVGITAALLGLAGRYVLGAFD